MSARHHHYLSQCYLKGFTKGGSKKSKLTVADLNQGKVFETIPRNVGGIRDFNRIESDKYDPDVLEKALSKFEGEAAKALKELSSSFDFTGETKDIILNLIGLIAVRSPQRRAHFAKFETEIMERVLDLSLESKERWESQIAQMRADGHDIDDSVTYEDVKRFHDSKEYTITVRREHQIELELSVLDTVIDCLAGRNWMVIKSTDVSGPLVTADNPVHLTWKEPEKIPPFYRQSPGHGLKGTQLYFPVSKDLGLVGEFDGNEGVFDGSKELFSALNTGLIINSHGQIYAPNLHFYFIGDDGDIKMGNRLIR